ncbi:hypothetical protein, partial [Ralstonia solanacearum]|uniref:hypothetical protein n=1 Tax=Ralstonia solanacearum TaxID=305 RepID=UPI001E3C47C1
VEIHSTLNFVHSTPNSAERLPDRTVKNRFSLNKLAELNMVEIRRERGPQFATIEVHAKPSRSLEAMKEINKSQNSFTFRVASRCCHLVCIPGGMPASALGRHR